MKNDRIEIESDEQARRDGIHRAYVAQAMEAIDPFEANVHLVIATLMAALNRLDRQYADPSGDGALDLDGLLRAMEMQTKLVREIEKLSRFAARHENDDVELVRRHFGK